MESRLAPPVREPERVSALSLDPCQLKDASAAVRLGAQLALGARCEVQYTNGGGFGMPELPVGEGNTLARRIEGRETKVGATLVRGRRFVQDCLA